MEVEFDISCKVTVDIDLDRNNIKNITNEELINKLKKYLRCCQETCEGELDQEGDFENIEVHKIKIEPDKELDMTLEDIAWRKTRHKNKKY